MKTVKKTISLILSLTIVLGCLFSTGINVFAADTANIRYFERGILSDGENTAYYLIDKDKRVLYLTGDGENTAKTPDYPSADEGPFAGRTDVTRIVIEEDVEKIGDYVFANMKSVDTLEIQSNLLKDSSMSTKAMIGCTGLRSVQGNSSMLSTDVLLEVIKGAINVASGNWVGLAKNILNIGKDGLTSDDNLDNDTIAALVDDYINTGKAVYFDDISTATNGYEERKSNPCYEHKKFNHSYTSVVTKEPDCENAGVRTYTCSKCGDTYTESIPALGHNYVDDVLYEPSCTKKGVKEYTCTRCGDIKLEPISPLGHKAVEIPAVAATCTSTGLTAGLKCSVCGEILKEQEVTPAIPHSYDYSYDESSDTYTGTCSVCGVKTTEFDNDLSALVSAVSLAKSFNPEDYTETSYKTMYSAVEKYLDLDENSKLQYPQFAVDEKTTEILTKISELTPYLKVKASKTTGGEATITYGDVTDDIPRGLALPFGEKITLTATANEGYTFKGWYEQTTQRYFSTDSSYTFTLSSNTDVKAVFTKSASATLTFKNDSGQIVKQITKTADEWKNENSLSDFLPAVPYKYGYTNGKWSYDETAVLSSLQRGRNADIAPVYDSLGITLPDKPNSPDGITPAVTLSYSLNQKDDKSYAGSFIMAADIPDGTDVVEIGTCFYRAEASTFDPTEFYLTLSNKTLVSKHDGIDEKGIYITNINGLTSKYNWAARGYVTYRDKEGNLHTAYSEQVNVIDRNQVK